MVDLKDKKFFDDETNHNKDEPKPEEFFNEEGYKCLRLPDGKEFNTVTGRVIKIEDSNEAKFDGFGIFKSDEGYKSTGLPSGFDPEKMTFDLTTEDILDNKIAKLRSKISGHEEIQTQEKVAKEVKKKQKDIPVFPSSLASIAKIRSLQK